MSRGEEILKRQVADLEDRLARASAERDKYATQVAALTDALNACADDLAAALSTLADMATPT